MEKQVFLMEVLEITNNIMSQKQTALRTAVKETIKQTARVGTRFVYLTMPTWNFYANVNGQNMNFTALQEDIDKVEEFFKEEGFTTDRDTIPYLRISW